VTRPLFWAGVVLFGACVSVACGSSLSTEAKQVEAEKQYGDALVACVHEAGAIQASRECRARVDREWDAASRPLIPADLFVQPATFIDGGPRDAGSDQ